MQRLYEGDNYCSVVLSFGNCMDPLNAPHLVGIFPIVILKVV